GFVKSRQMHEQIRTGTGLPHGGLWQLIFDELDQMPFDDGEMWEAHDLPVAAEDMYPTFMHINKSGKVLYPSCAELTWAEGLMRAITQTTEEELDTGRWKKQVRTFDGPAEYQFSMPMLLEQMAGKTTQDPTREFMTGRIQ